MKRKYIDPNSFNISEIINTGILARGKMDLPSSLHMLVGKLSQIMNDILNNIYNELENPSIDTEEEDEDSDLFRSKEYHPML